MHQSDVVARLSRRIGRAAEAVHGVVYYSPEIRRFDDDGFKGWWHAYFAHRAAPMGAVEPDVVTAVFYNFAPRMVARAIPGAWELMTPGTILARRQELVSGAMTRIFDPDTTSDGSDGDRERARSGDGAAKEDGADGAGGAAERRDWGPVIAEAAELATAALDPLDTGARPLTAALVARPWTERRVMALWHACTIWRELRGESHILALASAGIDPVQCHVLMAAHGRVNQPTISGIRGWNEEEWDAALKGLVDRGLVDAGGTYTDLGRAHRAEIERHTDRLSAQPIENLGPDQAGRLAEILEDLRGHLVGRGEVAGVWPPPAVRRW